MFNYIHSSSKALKKEAGFSREDTYREGGMFPGALGHLPTSTSSSPQGAGPSEAATSSQTPETARSQNIVTGSLLKQLTVITQALKARKLVKAEQLLSLKTDEVRQQKNIIWL
jgi:hypothetical protein